MNKELISLGKEVEEELRWIDECIYEQTYLEEKSIPEERWNDGYRKALKWMLKKINEENDY